MRLNAKQVDRIKLKIAVSLYYFDKYLYSDDLELTWKKVKSIEEDAMARYETDPVFWNKVNMLTNVIWETLEESDADD